MFCSKTLNSLINKTHKKALRLVYQKKNATLDELLKIDKSKPIHVKNLHSLMCEIFKTLNSLNPEFMGSFISFKTLWYKLTCSKTLSFTFSKYTF